jgi:hypothetical protein
MITCCSGSCFFLLVAPGRPLPVLRVRDPLRALGLTGEQVGEDLLTSPTTDVGPAALPISEGSMSIWAMVVDGEKSGELVTWSSNRVPTPISGRTLGAVFAAACRIPGIEERVIAGMAGP